MHRRDFLTSGLSLVAGAGLLERAGKGRRRAFLQDEFQPTPSYSIIPVVGDGKWIWTEPPKDQTGYLEPREYELKLGIQLLGTGEATELKATTAAPLQLPEQKVNSATITVDGCEAEIRQLAPEAGQLALAAPYINDKQVITATAKYRITLFKQYHGYAKEQFPVAQKVPKEIKKPYLFESPGIQSRLKEVREWAEKLGGQLEHPWDKARAYYEWVWENIQPRLGSYTSVTAALRDRVGDCEERASVFVAFCRAAEIPARLVWVPNHNWAEFYLHDERGQGHWIPAHTACYSWFGWTGVHELVLQKGDNIRVPEKSKPHRLVADWVQWLGAKPKTRYFAELKPLPPKDSSDAGPGARSKDEKGEWLPTGPAAEQPLVRR